MNISRARFSGFSPELEDALLQAEQSARSSARCNLCVDEALLAVVDQSPAISYLANANIDAARLREELEAHLAQWPRRDLGTEIGTPGASPAYQKVLLHAVIKAINKGTPLTIGEILEIILRERELRKGCGENELNLLLKEMAATDPSLARPAEMWWIRGYAPRRLTLDLGLRDVDVVRGLERARELLVRAGGQQLVPFLNIPDRFFFKPPTSLQDAFREAARRGVQRTGSILRSVFRG